MIIEIAVLIGCVLLFFAVMGAGAYAWGYWIDSGKWRSVLHYIKKNVHPW